MTKGARRIAVTKLERSSRKRPPQKAMTVTEDTNSAKGTINYTAVAGVLTMNDRNYIKMGFWRGIYARFWDLSKALGANPREEGTLSIYASDGEAAQEERGYNEWMARVNDIREWNFMNGFLTWTILMTLYFFCVLTVKTPYLGEPPIAQQTDAATGVIRLTDITFENYTFPSALEFLDDEPNKSKKRWLLFFHNKKDLSIDGARGLVRKFAAKWTGANKGEQREDNHVGFIDCYKEAMITCIRFKVTSYPTVMLLRRGLTWTRTDETSREDQRLNMTEMQSVRKFANTAHKDDWQGKTIPPEPSRVLVCLRGLRWFVTLLAKLVYQGIGSMSGLW
jgi:hypothetical protein